MQNLPPIWPPKEPATPQQDMLPNKTITTAPLTDTSPPVYYNATCTECNSSIVVAIKPEPGTFDAGYAKGVNEHTQRILELRASLESQIEAFKTLVRIWRSAATYYRRLSRIHERQASGLLERSSHHG